MCYPLFVMTLTEFNNKRSTLQIEGTGINTTTTKEKQWLNKTDGSVSFVIPINSKIHVDFSPGKYASQIFITYNDMVKVSKVVNAHLSIKGICKPPSISTLTRRSNTGISKSVTGKNVEPDGYGTDGSPSWELAMGII